MDNNKHLAFIARGKRFSPGSEAKDTAILTAVRDELLRQGVNCLAPVDEDELDELPEADGYVSMGRSQTVLNQLGEKIRDGVAVVNAPLAVMMCNYRCLLMQLLEEKLVSVPPYRGTGGYWVKRGMGCREKDGDIRFVPNLKEARHTAEQMRQEGMEHIDLRAHVSGRWYKFYGVSGTDFFRCYCPADEENGQRGTDRTTDCDTDWEAHERAVREVARKAVDALPGLDIYGGDCIVQQDGTAVLVDLNDWPSFGCCRQEAARAIAKSIKKRMDFFWSSEEED